MAVARTALLVRSMLAERAGVKDESGVMLQIRNVGLIEFIRFIQMRFPATFRFPNCPGNRLFARGFQLSSLSRRPGAI